jgi:hypothetical protein
MSDAGGSTAGVGIDVTYTTAGSTASGAAASTACGGTPPQLPAGSNSEFNRKVVTRNVSSRRELCIQR